MVASRAQPLTESHDTCNCDYSTSLTLLITPNDYYRNQGLDNIAGLKQDIRIT